MKNYNDYQLYLMNNGYFKRCVEPEGNVNTNMFTNPEEGFIKGNMQANLYKPYKNMQPIKPNIPNEKEALLYQIQMYGFASHDINLYLDTHPNDNNAINQFNYYNNEKNKLVKSYESKYGPLNLNSDIGLNSSPWTWDNEPWPWNKNI